jgi:hypothetical protein
MKMPTPEELTNALAEAEYFIDNPSAWDSFDQRVSDAIAKLTDLIRTSETKHDLYTDADKDPHAELRKTYLPGQRWQTRGVPDGEWIDTIPCWFADQEYRRAPDDRQLPAHGWKQEDDLLYRSGPDGFNVEEIWVKKFGGAGTMAARRVGAAELLKLITG